MPQRVADILTWAELVGRPEEPHDQGARHTRRARCPGALGGRRRELNVTLIFSSRQYRAARDAIWRGAAPRDDFDGFKSVYSIFVSRLGRVHGESGPAAFARRARPGGHPECQADLGGKSAFLGRAAHAVGPGDRLCQHGHEETRASRRGSTSRPSPAATSRPILPQPTTPWPTAGWAFTRRVDILPPEEVMGEIDRLVDMERLEATLDGRGDRQVCPTAEGAAGTHYRETPGPCRGRGQGESLGDPATKVWPLPPRADLC